MSNESIDVDQYIAADKIKKINQAPLDEQADFIKKFFMIDEMTCKTSAQFKLILSLICDKPLD